jgi:hypothetical protein
MIQDSNITINQFSSYCLQACLNEWNDLESGPRLYRPELIFGEYKDESDDNWTVETIWYVGWQ